MTPSPAEPATGPVTADQAPARDRFRPDLEGLRALAVVLVLLYHAEIPGFGGGFVGVDVFFVLSGFLITGLIVREIGQTGRVSLPAFYARRARRLVPAALLVIAVTMLASVFLLPPLRVPDVAGDAAASALYVSNIRFALQATDYLQADVAPSPLLHYWSLGVEEHFYLVWPALLAITAGLARGRTRLIALVIAVVAGASLALSIVLTDAAAPWAFFSLPTRAWELGLGAIVAVTAVHLARAPARLSAGAAAAGVGLIVAAGIVIGQDTPYPGLAALLPTIGAALVIAAGTGGTVSATARLLGRRPVRFMGRISYSLYLWHWPILVLPAAALGTALPMPARIGLALLAIPIAAASQRWVEEPIHRGRLLERFGGRRPSRSLALAGVLSLAVALVSVGAGAAFGLSASGPITPLSSDLAANEQLLAAATDPAGREPGSDQHRSVRPPCRPRRHRPRPPRRRPRRHPCRPYRPRRRPRGRPRRSGPPRRRPPVPRRRTRPCRRTSSRRWRAHRRTTPSCIRTAVTSDSSRPSRVRACSGMRRARRPWCSSAIHTPPSGSRRSRSWPTRKAFVSSR